MITWLALLLLVIGRQIVPAISLTALGTGFLYSIPLLAPLPGLLRGDRYTHSWATLCVLPYFIVGITEAVVNPASHAWAIALLGTSLLWFFMLVSFLRVTPKS
ncbi:MAG: DUF2069 domain-containing protein [Steroidobacter sp.]